MNNKIEKNRKELKRLRAKLKEIQEGIRTLEEKEIQLENEDIIESIRNMTPKDMDVMDVLELLMDSNSGKGKEGDTNEPKQMV